MTRSGHGSGYIEILVDFSRWTEHDCSVATLHSGENALCPCIDFIFLKKSLSLRATQNLSLAERCCGPRGSKDDQRTCRWGLVPYEKIGRLNPHGQPPSAADHRQARGL